MIAALAAVWVTTAAPAAGVRPTGGVTEHPPAVPTASAPSAPVAPAPPKPAAPAAPAAPAVPAGDSTELDAVVAAPVRDLSANTPMPETNATRYLARAWSTVMKAPPSEGTLCVLWAHWAHETGRGQRMHAYNFAGLKGRGPTGASVVVWTREGTSGDLVQRTFRAYRGPQEGARDYLRLLADRYPSAVRAARDGNAYGFASALDSGGYFTGDERAYLRALSSLSIECRRRGLGARPAAPGTGGE